MPGIEIAAASDSVGAAMSLLVRRLPCLQLVAAQQTDYAAQQRNRLRRAMNRLASAQVRRSR